MSPSVIAILSDLGTRDYFVGAMKGAILSINPGARIVDISHEIPKRDVLVGAFVLASAAETFPRGTVFVSVVDPGVGTERKCILLETKNGLLLVGPDNGLFTFVAGRFRAEKIYEVKNRELMRQEISPTFQGRDIMAPVAAHLSLGVEPRKVGPELGGIKKLEIPRPKLAEKRILGQVLTIDDFGNLITNIGGNLISKFAKLGETLGIRIADKELNLKFVEKFGDVRAGDFLCYVGSSRLLEVGENMGNLAQRLKVNRGSDIVLQKVFA